MTMKPRVRKFRIRREDPVRPAHDAEAHDAENGVPPETGAGAPSQDQGDAHAQDDQTATGIDDTTDQGLSARQLRLARRTAQKHGLSPASDFDAVRQLRKRGHVLLHVNRPVEGRVEIVRDLDPGGDLRGGLAVKHAGGFQFAGQTRQQHHRLFCRLGIRVVKRHSASTACKGHGPAASDQAPADNRLLISSAITASPRRRRRSAPVR